jgi:hypothetical protein
MATTDAKPLPIKNQAFRWKGVVVDATGAPVTGGLTGLDTELSLDDGNWTDATNEFTETQTSGRGYLDLTAAEMNYDSVGIRVQSNEGITIHAELYPKEAGDIAVDLEANAVDSTSIANDAITAAKIATDAIGASEISTLGAVKIAGEILSEDLTSYTTTNTLGALFNGLAREADTAQAGAAGTITLAAGASAVDDFYNGQTVILITNTGVGQSRIITDYDGTTKVATVDTNWATAPDGTTVYQLYNAYQNTTDATLTAAAIADAVLEEVVSDHTSVSGSLAAIINSLQASSVNVSSGIAFESRVLRRQKVRYNDDNDDNPIVYQRNLNGVKVTPSSATIQIFAPGNSTAVLDATAMTIDGTLAKYSVDTTTTSDFPVGEGYRARILATISGTVYPDDIYFDVAKHIVNLDIGYDQLVGLDSRISGMEHAGDETFAALIEAVRDEIQLRLETASAGNKQFLETMIVDKSRISIPARFLVLARVMRAKGHKEEADEYMAEFRELWRAMLQGTKIDKDGDQEEDGRQGQTTRARLEY